MLPRPRGFKRPAERGRERNRKEGKWEGGEGKWRLAQGRPKAGSGALCRDVDEIIDS